MKAAGRARRYPALMRRVGGGERARVAGRRERRVVGQFRGAGAVVSHDGLLTLPVQYELTLMEETAPRDTGGGRLFDGSGVLMTDAPPQIAWLDQRNAILRLDDGREIDVIVTWRVADMTHRFTAPSGFRR